MFKQGDILLVPFPFSNLLAYKQRPVLVLSKDNSGDIITCGITSNTTEKKNSIRITTENLQQGTLPKPSIIKIDKLFTLEQALVRRKLGEVDTYTMHRAIQQFHLLV